MRSAPDPYEEFKKIAREASAGKVKLAEPWESLRVLIMPKPSEEEKLMWGRGAGLYSKYRGDENYRRALFYATLALEEAFGGYRSALREYVEEREKVVQRVEVGEEPFKRVVYVADVGRLAQLAKEEEAAFEKALSTLRERLNEYAVRHGLGGLLNVEEGKARGLAEAKRPELSRFSGVNFGVKAYAALIAYREYALGRRGAYGIAAGYWLEVGGSAWLLCYAPRTAYDRAEKARAEKPVAVEKMAAKALRRLFLKPGADHHSDFVEELTKGGKLALELEEEKNKEKTESHMFRLYRLEEGGGPKELGIKLSIRKVGESIVYTLELDARWREFFKQELEAAEKAAREVERRLPVEDRFSYMAGWVDSDVAIVRNKKGKRMLRMTTSHLWQLAETHALFGWSKVVGLRMSLTLEGPKLAVIVEAPLGNLDEVIKRSAEGGWLKMLGVETESWDGLKRWVSDHWSEVIDAVKRQLEGVKVGSGFDLTRALEELERSKNRLNDDKIAREVIAPVLLLIQAERLGVNETTLKHFAAVASGAIDGDGHVSAAMEVVGLTSDKHTVALLWAAAFAAHGIKAEVRRIGSVFQVVASGGDAARLARLYFLSGPPLLEGDERFISHKLAEAVKLGARGVLSVSWEGLRRRTEGGPVAADLTISVDGVAVKYNVYLSEKAIELQFQSTDRNRVELAARLLRLAGVVAEVKKEGSRDAWYVRVATDRLAAGREELRKAIAEIVREAAARDWVDEKRAELWLEKLEEGLTLREGWPRYEVGLAKGALMVRFSSTNSGNIEREKQRLENMGLEEGRHFTVKMPEGGKAGYVSILREGLERAAWLSVYGSGEQQRLADEFVKLILQRAEEKGVDVYKKALEIVNEGKSWRSLKLEDFEGRVEVNGRIYVVKVTGWGAEIEKKQNGKKLLRIRITAEVGRVEGEHTIVDRVVREYTITFGKYNMVVGRAVARADAPGGREADAERLAAVVEALTGVKPNIRHMKDGTIIIECYRRHLEGFRRYVELADTIEEWLEETG